MSAHGFTGGPRSPETNIKPPNETLDFKKYHISHNPSSAGYGCATTAIALMGRVFLVLNGDHRQALAAIAGDNELQACMDYFVDNLAQANPLSEHHVLIGDKEDMFGLIPTALETIGQEGIDRIAQAAQNLPGEKVSITSTLSSDEDMDGTLDLSSGPKVG